MVSPTAGPPSLTRGSLCRQSSAIRTGCANERPSGSVRGVSREWYPYRDLSEALATPVLPIGDQALVNVALSICLWAGVGPRSKSSLPQGHTSRNRLSRRSLNRTSGAEALDDKPPRTSVGIGDYPSSSRQCHIEDSLAPLEGIPGPGRHDR
jgi:hypothetical protein